LDRSSTATRTATVRSRRSARVVVAGFMLTPLARDQLARLLDVAGQRSDQVVDGAEALLVAQAAAELQPQRRPIDVAVEVEQVRLYPDSLARVGEGRVVADADRRRMARRGEIRAAGVDPSAGQHAAAERFQVG